MLADILLPLAIDGVFTYNIPDALLPTLRQGVRVLVPLGKKKQLSGILLGEHKEPLPEGIAVRDVICPIDEEPIVTPEQIHLWQWIADYYMCSIGEVMKAALPASLRLESETQVRLSEDFVAENKLSVTAQKILEILEARKATTIDEISKKTGIKNILPALQKLQQIGAVSMGEKVEDKYRKKTETHIRLSDELKDNESTLQEVFSSLQKSPKQRHLLTVFLSLTEDKNSIRRDELLALSGSSAGILKQLIDKSILVTTQVDIDRLKHTVASRQTYPLNPQQERAFGQIKELFEEKEIVLLHGVTGSGKTEIYTHLIDETIRQGKQVLYLVPEIALTTQLTNRLQAVFGERLGVYHSRFSDDERVEIYQNLLQQKSYQIILGVRSSLFLPFSNLGLIIIDEEQDSSYKQQEPAPRYHARNAALMLARFFKAKTLMGTATPSVETYYNAQEGRYGLVELQQRHADIKLPVIRLVDTKEQYHRKQMQGHFADEIVSTITDEIRKNKQVIVFQNRRGYAPWIECKQCAYIPKCTNCDVSLTLHKQQGTLVCHYCGYTIPLPSVCPSCKQPTLSDRGMGTEKVEDELRTLFPEAKIARMDLDTTRNKHAYERLINDFADHHTDILVGTQMVSKGLDFNDVSTVAVLNADATLNQPDFRSNENAFQLLSQVSGRAGRKGQQGQVLIQTSNPDNEVLHFVQNHDYKGLYQQQIQERQAFKYPPYYRLLTITVKHRDFHLIDKIATQLQTNLKAVFTHRCSRVTMPVVNRVQNMYIRQIMLKIAANEPYQKAKDLLAEQIRLIHETTDGKSAVIFVDVDPN